MEEISDDPIPGRWIDDEDVDAVTTLICSSAAGPGWIRDVELQLGPKRWRPSAASDDRRRLLYVFLQEELPRFVVERLRLAAANGLSSSVALNIASLFKPEILELLVEIDADVLVLDDYNEARRLQPRPLLGALADIEVPVSPGLRKALANVIWARIGDGSSYEKGRRLEVLLAFVFAQIADLKVVERNYRNETEEIDLVLQIDAFSPRIWQNPGVPFMLVEAKNRVEKASQQVMSTLIAKLQTKRGTARIAMLISLSGFTEDAKLQELRFSTQDICVVMIDREQLEAILVSDDIDGEVEVLVRRALLR